MSNGGGTSLNEDEAFKYNNPIITTNLMHNKNYRLGWDYNFILNMSPSFDKLSNYGYQQADRDYQRAMHFHARHPHKNYVMKIGILIKPAIERNHSLHLRTYRLLSYKKN